MMGCLFGRGCADRGCLLMLAPVTVAVGVVVLVIRVFKPKLA